MPERKILSEIEQKHKKIAIRLALFFACLILADFLVISIFFGWQDWVALLIFSLLFIVPAYISNASMVITGGGKPIDGGKNWRDGRRILGDHKTWNGLIKGPLYIGIPISIGVFIFFLLIWSYILPLVDNANQAEEYKIYNDVAYFQYYFIGGPFPLGFIALIVRIILCSAGAGIGDLIGSFLKRRLGFESGSFMPIIDELDFALFAILLTSIPAFFLPELFWFPDWYIITFLIILTPAVSVIANTIAYLIGLKDVPW
ncbi:MAG: CDP-2,3-bis-(O-geranylgeranyl)-sn-glycerol synthase [Promethearchaeota archaeon]